MPQNFHLMKAPFFYFRTSAWLKTVLVSVFAALIGLATPSCKDDDSTEPEEVLPDTFAIEFGTINFSDLPVQFVIEDTTGSGTILARNIFTNNKVRDFKGGFEMLTPTEKKILRLITSKHYKVAISINNLLYEETYYTPIKNGYIDVLIDAEGVPDILKR